MVQKALIFANGDANDGPMVRRALADAGGALAIAADGGARIAAFYGVQLDRVVGDMDSLDKDELSTLKAAGAEIEQYPAHKNETDLELALIRAAERGATWIRIIGGVGDRIDQTLSNIYLMALPVLKGDDVRLVAGKQETRLLHPGTTAIHGEPGDTISLVPLTGIVRGVRTENLYYPLRDEDLFFGPARGVSNVISASPAQVSLRDGVLMLVHTLGRA